MLNELLNSSDKLRVFDKVHTVTVKFMHLFSTAKM